MTQEQAPRPSGKGPKVNSIRTSTMTSFTSHNGVQQFCIYSYCFSGFGQAPPPDHVPGTSSKREVTLFGLLDTHLWFDTQVYGGTASWECFRDWELKQEWASSRENRNASRYQIITGRPHRTLQHFSPQEQVRLHLICLRQILLLPGWPCWKYQSKTLHKCSPTSFLK